MIWPAVVVAVISAVGAAVQARTQKKAAKKAEDKQEGAAHTQQSAQEAEDIAARRKRVREDRVIRAKLLAASEAGGTSGSSSEGQALSANTVNQGAAFSAQRAQSNFAEAQTASLQGASEDLRKGNEKAAKIGLITKVATSVASIAGGASSQPKGPSSPTVFNTGGTSTEGGADFLSKRDNFLQSRN